MQCSLSGDASPTRPSAGPLQPTASIQFVSCCFCGAAALFVSPKLQVFNQRLIQNFLWMCPWTQYRTTPISRATQSTVRRNCPLCSRCFRNIPLQNRDRISSHRLKQSRHNCIIFLYTDHTLCVLRSIWNRELQQSL